MRPLLAALFLAGSTLARAALPEAESGRPWFRPEATFTAAPAATAAPAFRVQYEMGAHMDMTQEAYRLYASLYGGGELAQFIGSYTPSGPESYDKDNVIAGAYEEDVPYRNPWNEQFPQFRHFWDCRKNAGWSGHDTAANRAQKYMTGGYGFDGAYDAGWAGGGDDTGAKGLGVLGLYAAGNKDKAYWYLGHAAHLLEDVTVPAHALLWPHPFGQDAYESYMTSHRSNWMKKRPAGAIPDSVSLHALFYANADAADDFDAGTGPGASGVDGKRDRGARRAAGFTQAALKQEGDVLWPQAVRSVAALFVHFYRQVDHTAPRVKLDRPRVKGGRVTLRARAEDDQSGVARLGYRFEYAALREGRWTGCRPVPGGAGASGRVLNAAAGVYAFRASAVDAAGNVGRSRARRVEIVRPALLALQ